jgi:hypothetical protein
MTDHGITENTVIIPLWIWIVYGLFISVISVLLTLIISDLLHL